MLAILCLCQFVSLGKAESKIHYQQAFWQPGFSAGGRYVSPAWSGPVDAGKDLGIGSTQGVLRKLTIDVSPRLSVSVAGFEGTFAGQAMRKERKYFLGGLISREVTHRATENINLQYKSADLYFLRNVRKEEGTNTAWVLGVRRVSATGSAVLRSKIPESSEVVSDYAFSWAGWAPVVGVHWEEKKKHVTWSATAAGLSTGTSGLTFVDVDIQAAFCKQKNSSLVVGYRGLFYRDRRTLEKTQIASVDIKGPYWGLMFYF